MLTKQLKPQAIRNAIVTQSLHPELAKVSPAFARYWNIKQTAGSDGQAVFNRFIKELLKLADLALASKKE